AIRTLNQPGPGPKQAALSIDEVEIVRGSRCAATGAEDDDNAAGRLRYPNKLRRPARISERIRRLEVDDKGIEIRPFSRSEPPLEIGDALLLVRHRPIRGW